MTGKVSLTTRVYEAIKAEARSGAFPPGQPISAAQLSQRYSSSIIPVREALYRLVGERLIEVRDHHGFHAPRIGEVGLRDLYQSQLCLLLCALEHHPAPRLKQVGKSGVDPAEPSLAAIRRLFTYLADNADSGEVHWALHNLLDRLHAVSSIKEEVAENWASECDRLLREWQRGDPQDFKDALSFYHRRCVELVPALVERLNLPRTPN